MLKQCAAGVRGHGGQRVGGKRQAVRYGAENFQAFPFEGIRGGRFEMRHVRGLCAEAGLRLIQSGQQMSGLGGGWGMTMHRSGCLIGCAGRSSGDELLQGRKERLAA